jgi:glycosyltransferase involved in cell wall biosynthesis
MRLAVVDLVFSWPPNGGADVDLFNVVSQLRARGHEVHVFVAGDATNWERGTLDPASLPFPVSLLDFSALTLNGPTVARRFRAAVDAYAPDVVLVANGFFLKPFVIDALSHYPLIGRYYTYEAICIRDSLLFKDGAPCPYDFLRTPDLCRRCALDGLKPAILGWRHGSWSHEFLVSGAPLPGFHRRHTEALRKLKAAIVSNDVMARRLEGFVDRTFVVPGGVNVADYAVAPPPRGEKALVLMTGRAGDPLKGFDVLFEAGRRLAQRRSDFEIWATHTNRFLDNAWFKAVGWHPHEAVLRMYERASICVVPSLCEEAFGLVAVEAMASARPVCASRVGGLKDIVRDGETGLLFDRGDVAALEAGLDRLLDDEALRRAMGDAGRRRAGEEFDWGRIAETHYDPILEAVRS